MIGILRCVDGQLLVHQDTVGKYFIVPEHYTQPMPGDERGDGTLYYERRFRRVHTFCAEPKRGDWDGEALAFLYLEEAPQADRLPPEILSRRTQEVEAEWLRLGRLLDDLRALESEGAR